MMRRLAWRPLALLLLASIASAAAARVPEAARVTTADGLPSNAVHQVVQDRQGYLWFATDDGLARFDGRQFRLWRREQGLADNVLPSLAVDAQDQLWMGTGYGTLMRMSADRSRIDGFGGAGHPALAGVPISAVLPDAEGSVSGSSCRRCAMTACRPAMSGIWWSMIVACSG
jgi:ligand-binding sensor domain-containing protein